MPAIVVQDALLVLSHFARDSNYSTERTRCFIDRESGRVLWLLGQEDLDAEVEMEVAASPGRYVEIVSLDHSDHHSILQEFIASDWTDDAEDIEAARRAYGPRSVGAFKENVEPSTWHAFEEYKEGRTLGLLIERLRRFGLEPELSF